MFPYAQEGAKVVVRFNTVLPDNYESVKAISRQAVFRQKPSFVDVLEDAVATIAPSRRWEAAL